MPNIFDLTNLKNYFTGSVIPLLAIVVVAAVLWKAWDGNYRKAAEMFAVVCMGAVLLAIVVAGGLGALGTDLINIA